MSRLPRVLLLAPMFCLALMLGCSSSGPEEADTYKEDKALKAKGHPEMTKRMPRPAKIEKE